MTRSTIAALAGALALAAAGLFAACAGPRSAGLAHPEKLAGPPNCTACHEAGLAALNHDARWATTHGAVAAREQRSCELCHKPSLCADCHANKEEIKPTDKRPSRFDAASPHRGDYLTQHRVDGRVDPASCFPCHGRRNEERCRTCHR